MRKANAHIPINQRIVGIVTALEHLALGIEIIRQGTDKLILTLPEGCGTQRRLLLEQVAALERVSISLGMIQETVEGFQKDVSNHINLPNIHPRKK